MPKPPTLEDLRNLLEPRTEPCISVFLPLPRHGPDLASAPLRFRALLREAETLLSDRYDARRVKGLLAPLAGCETHCLGIPRDAMTPILDYSGMPLTAKVVVDAVSAHVAAGAARPGAV